MKFLYVHTSFHYYHLQPPYSRQEYPTHANGFMNQIQSIVNALQIADKLERTLVIDCFYPDYSNKTLRIPIDKIIQLESLQAINVPRTRESMVNDMERFQLSSVSHGMISMDKHEWLDHVFHKESEINYLEVDCCYYYCFDRARYRHNLNLLRFHPFLYSLFHDNFHVPLRYHVVHYRMETDFSDHMCKYFKPPISSSELMDRMYRTYDTLVKSLTKDIPIVFACGHFPEKYSLGTFLEYKLSKDMIDKIRVHINVEIASTLREIHALFDYLLATNSNISSFTGVLESSFSLSVVEWHHERVDFKLISLNIVDNSMILKRENLISLEN
jgi:hypothetical protein